MIGFKAKAYALLAALGLGLLAFVKVIMAQRDAAREDARRAKKHLTEAKDIGVAQKEIRRVSKEVEKKAVEDIKNGKMPDNIRDRNTF